MIAGVSDTVRIPVPKIDMSNWPSLRMFVTPPAPFCTSSA